MTPSGPSTSPAPRLGDLARGAVGALVGYLIGTYGAGSVLDAMLRAGRGDLVLEWAWFPWMLGAVLCGIGAGFAVPAVRRRAWWTWAAATAPVPVCAFFLILATFPAGIEVDYPEVALDALVQVLVAAALATGIGLLRSRAEGRAALRAGRPGLRASPRRRPRA